MTKRDRAALGKYLRDLADKLELRDWTVLLEVGEPGGPHDARPDGKTWGASSESTPGQRKVTVTLPENCREWSAENLRQTAAHELIHAHLAPLSEMWRVDLHPMLSRDVYYLFNDNATRWLEFAVEAMADATAPHLPLMEWPA